MDFHVRLAVYAGNEVLAAFLEQLVARTPVIIMLHGEPEHRASCSEDEHENIVAAILSDDRDKAVALMRSHLDHLERHVAPATEHRKPNWRASTTYPYGIPEGMQYGYVGRTLCNVRGCGVLGGHETGCLSALSEKQLKQITGNHPENPTLDLPCREVFESGQRRVEMIGPMLF